MPLIRPFVNLGSRRSRSSWPKLIQRPLWHFAFGTQRTADIIGTIEVIIALLIAVRPVAPRVSALGSALACLTFLTTLSFLVTTPGMAIFTPAGFPFLSMIGPFLIKDIVLLGASLYTLGEALVSTDSGAASYRPHRA